MLYEMLSLLTSKEPAASSKPTSSAAPTPEPPAFDTSILLGIWDSNFSLTGTPIDEANYFITFDSSTAKYEAGFWRTTYTPYQSIGFESLETQSFTYRVEGNSIHFIGQGIDSVYRVSFPSEYELELSYVSGPKLSSWETMRFYNY